MKTKKKKDCMVCRDYTVCIMEKIFTIKETEEIDVNIGMLMFFSLNGFSGLSLGLLWAMPRNGHLGIVFLDIITLLTVFWIFCFSDDGLTTVKVRKLIPRADVKI